MNKLTPQQTDFSKWYNEVIDVAGLADHSPVRGCMVIRPYGYAIWENLQRELDMRIKETGHENAYFPLLIPKSFLCKEAEHVEGFAKECAVVTHSRLMATQRDGKSVVEVDPDSKLEEELIVRPTSETVIHAMFAKWIQSWRDLPLLINQWANIVRWEMRTRLFLRTAEFLWQEGHTAHATPEEAQEETMKMLFVYRDFLEGFLAIPVIPGRKSASERFAGADETYAVEAMMRDGKALQAGTSHNLGQNFAKAFDIKFQNVQGELAHVWQTSWGVSTRLIGAIIMTHGDDKGLILPPKVAPVQVVIVPIYKTEEEKALVRNAALDIRKRLPNLRVKIDDREQYKPGSKFYEWEKKGVPMRLELGPREVAEGKVMTVDRLSGQKEAMPIERFVAEAEKLLDDVHARMLERALRFRRENTFEVDDYAEFQKKLEAQGGFYEMHWCGSPQCEEKIKDETKATIRCISLEEKEQQNGKCVCCQAPSERRVVFARAY